MSHIPTTTDASTASSASAASGASSTGSSEAAAALPLAPASRQARFAGRVSRSWAPALVLAGLFVVVPTALTNDAVMGLLGARGEQSSYVELGVADPSKLDAQITPQGDVALRFKVINRTGGERRIGWRADTFALDGSRIAENIASGQTDLVDGEGTEQVATFTMACDRKTMIQISITEPADTGTAVHVWVDSSASDSPTKKPGGTGGTPTCRI